MRQLFGYDAKSIENEFLDELCNTIELSAGAYKPSATYKPSSLKCLREMYFIMKKVDTPKKREDYTFVGIKENGTDRHTRLQNIISKMKTFEYISPAYYIQEKKLKDLKVLGDYGNETLIHNSRYNMNLMTDGILKHKDEYFLLEIKTEGAHKFYDRNGVAEEHYNQAICYSLSFGINKVIFLYENRDFLDKKAYLFTVTPKMKKSVIDMIEACNDYLNKNVVPPKDKRYGTSFCQYCNYRSICKGI